MQRPLTLQLSRQSEEPTHLQTSYNDLKNIDTLIEKFYKLSEHYQGDELYEKVEILRQVYWYYKRRIEGKEQQDHKNFFDTFAKKYQTATGNRSNYTNREEWEEAHQREKCLIDIDRFEYESGQLCGDHVEYLNALLRKSNSPVQVGNMCQEDLNDSFGH